MTPSDFVYWLNGFVELTDGLERPSERQWQVIKDHLQLVFEKQTPDRGNECDYRMLIEPDQSMDTLQTTIMKCEKGKSNVSDVC